VSAPVDFPRAARRAARLASELNALVAGLRDAAATAPEHVGRITGLVTEAERAAANPVLVVDRAGWSRANAALMAHASDGILPPAGRIGAALAGEETGALLAYLSTKVLGQLDPFTPGGPRLLLVAPNVLTIERELDLDARDFRRWVALHEQTHAVQFAAAPWLADHLLGALGSAVAPAATDTDRDVRALVPTLVKAVRSRGETESIEIAGPLVDSFLTPTERERLTEIVALMSLLEGHADVVMDAVGPTLLPSVKRIRSSFDRRRDGRGPVDVLLRSLLGMRAKVAQYRNGAVFVRTVVRRVGHAGLNAAWTGPEMLPTSDELLDPGAWISRVHG
jgi:coenzyme F420 biosynthesis associated uncharacterized protein